MKQDWEALRQMGICRLKIWVPFFFVISKKTGLPHLESGQSPVIMRSPIISTSEVPQIEVAFDLDSNGVRNPELLAWVRNLPGNLVTFSGFQADDWMFNQEIMQDGRYDINAMI